jgi:hypothetical protein
MPRRTLQPLIVALIAGLSPAASARTPIDIANARQTITMDYLMESCTVVGETAGGLVNYFDCESYLYGLLEAQVELNPALSDGSRACVPASVAPWQIYEQLSGIEQPTGWSGPAAPIILRELRHRYPCR